MSANNSSISVYFQLLYFYLFQFSWTAHWLFFCFLILPWDLNCSIVFDPIKLKPLCRNHFRSKSLGFVLTLGSVFLASLSLVLSSKLAALQVSHALMEIPASFEPLAIRISIAFKSALSPELSHTLFQIKLPWGTLEPALRSCSWDGVSGSFCWMKHLLYEPGAAGVVPPAAFCFPRHGTAALQSSWANGKQVSRILSVLQVI